MKWTKPARVSLMRPVRSSDSASPMRHTLLAASVSATLALVCLPMADGAQAAPNMGTTPVISTSAMPALAEAVAAAVTPSTGTPVYVAPPANSVALVQASANASATGGIALVAPANYDPVAVKQTLGRWPVGQVRLFGPTGAFPAAFVSGLQPAYTVDSTRVGASRYQWSEASVNASLRRDVVLANGPAGPRWSPRRAAGVVTVLARVPLRELPLFRPSTACLS